MEKFKTIINDFIKKNLTSKDKKDYHDDLLEIYNILVDYIDAWLVIDQINIIIAKELNLYLIDIFNQLY